MTMPNLEKTLFSNIVRFIQGDLRKLKATYDIYLNHESILKNKQVYSPN